VAYIVLNISSQLVSDRVQAYSSKITLYFQLQNNDYLYHGVTVVQCIGLPAPNPSLFLYTLNVTSNV